MKNVFYAIWMTAVVSALFIVKPRTMRRWYGIITARARRYEYEDLLAEKERLSPPKSIYDAMKLFSVDSKISSYHYEKARW